MVAAVRIARSWWRQHPVWGWGIVSALTVALVVGAFVLPATGASATLRPDGGGTSAVNAWTVSATEPPSVLADGNNATHYNAMSNNTRGYAGVQAASGVLPAGSQITQISVTFTARGDGDERVDFGVRINGTDDLIGDSGSTAAVTPGTTASTYTEVFNAPTSPGYWTVAELDTLDLLFVYLRTGNPLSRIYVTEAVVNVTYTAPTPTLTVAPGADRPTARVFRGQGATGVVADQIALTATAGQGNVDVSRIVVSGLDTAATLQADVTAVRLYRDDGDGAFEPGTDDPQLGTQQIFNGNASGSTAAFNGLTLSVPAGSTAKIWVVYDIGPSAVDGHLVGSRVLGAGGSGTNGTDITVGAGQTVTTFTNITSANAGQSIQVDATPPAANTTDPVNSAVLSGATKQIAGTASDGTGSGLASVQVSIQRASDSNYWNGTGWQAGVAWNAVTGTANWTYDWALDAGQNRSTAYSITARATDALGLVGVDASPVTGVTVDNVGPSMLSATAIDATTVDVVFNEPLSSASIAPADFAVTGGLTVSAAVLQADNVTVRLTTSAQTPSTTYTVSLPGAVNDVAGNADTNNTVNFNGFVPTPALTVSAGADAPAAKAYVLRGSVGAVDQIQLAASNGAITVESIVVRGMVSGGLLSDIAQVRLFVDDGDDVFDGGDTQLGSGVTFSGTTATFSSLAYPVADGVTRRVWVVYTVGALAPNGAVFGSSIQTGDVSVTAPATVTFSTSPITSANAGSTLEVDAFAPVTTITSPSASALLTGASTTIQGTASDDPDGAGPLTGSGVGQVQVSIARSNGTWWDGSGWVGAETWVAASGASNWTYAWTLPVGEDRTRTYTISARATDAVTNTTTVPASLSGITVDTQGPSIVSIPPVSSATQVDVVFSEPLASASIAAGDFSIAGLTVSGAALQADNVTVRLTTSAQTAGQLYAVQVSAGALTDANGVANPVTSRSFTGYMAPSTSDLRPDAFAANPLGGPTFANTTGNNNWNVAGAITPASFVGAFSGTGGTVASAGRNLSYLNMSTADFSSAASSIASVDLVVVAQNTGGTNRNLTIAAYPDANGASALASATNLVPSGGGWQTYTLSAVPDPGADGWSVADLNSLAMQLTTAAVNSTLQVDEVYFRVTYYAAVGGTLSVAQASELAAPDLPDAPEFVSRGDVRVVDAYELTASGGDIPVDGITITGLGTQDLLATDVSAVRLYTDGNVSGAFYADSETQLGFDVPFDASVSGTGKAVFSGLNHVVADGTTSRIWVVYVVGSGAADGDRVGARLGDGAIVVASGSVAGFADIVSPGAGQTLAIDAAGPTVSITGPTASQVLTGASTTVAGTASDGTGSGVNLVQVRIARADGTWYDRVSGTFTGIEAWNGADTSDGWATWSMPWTLPGSENGTYTYTVSARAADGLSQVGAVASNAGIRVDNVGPSFTSAAPMNATTIDVFLNEPVDPATIAASGSDFAVTGATITGATVQAGNARIRLTLAAPMSVGANHTVSADPGAFADPYGNTNGATSAGFVYSSVDTTAPTMSTDVSAAPGGSSPVIATVTWSSATDDVAVAGYRIYRAPASGGTFTLIGTTAAVSFDDTTGVPGQDYWYRVTAYDAAGNESDPYPTSGDGPVAATWTQAPHATYSASTKLCRMCHAPHQAGTIDNILRDTGSTPGELGTCYACHDGSGASGNIKTGAENSFALASGHTLEAAAEPASADLTDACSGCHSPHRDYTASRMLPSSTVNGVAVAAADNTWCLACHNASNDWFEGSYPGTAAPSRDATGYPVSGTFPGPATYNDPVKNAHVSIEASATIEREAGDCLYCHSSHRSASDYDSLIAGFGVPEVTDASLATYDDYAALCFTCHGTDGHDAFATPPSGAVDIQQFVTANGLRSGHRIKTPGGDLPVGAPLPCWDCHNAHGSSRGNDQLITDELGQALGTSTAVGDEHLVREFCFVCHTTAGDVSGGDGLAYGWDSVNGVYSTAIASGKTIEGLARDAAVGANVLRLPEVNGHYRDDAQSCYKCHGSSYAAGGSNVHNPSGGVSQGGEPCYACHSQYQTYMEDGVGDKVGDQRVTVYHHVMGGNYNGGAYQDGDFAPGPSGTYPTSGYNQFFCVTCHVDHDRFNDTPGANLRQQFPSFDGSTANTDFDTAYMMGGVCTSCHGLAMPKDTTDQKPGSILAQPINSGRYDASAHQYKVASEFGTGNSFQADCSKCHNDEQTKEFQTSDAKFGTHWSANSRLLSAFGAPVAETLGATHCYGCHSEPGAFPGAKTVADRDYYGNAGAAMSQLSQRVYEAFNDVTGSKHPIGTSGAGVVTCENCHNPHNVQKDPGVKVSNPENTLELETFATAADQAAFCLDCHDGTGVTGVSDPVTYVPMTVTMASALDNKGTNAARGHWSVTGAISAGEVVPCEDCHDNHGSGAPKLLGEYDAVTGLNFIGTTQITANDNTVCGACHTAASTGFPAGETARDAAGYLDAGTWPGMARYTTAYASATHTGSPHSTIPAGAYPQGDCKHCHDVHGTANKYDMLKGTFDPSSTGDDEYALCFSCHDGTVGTDIRTLYPIASGGTNAGARAGHKVVSSVAGAKLAAGDALPCYDCHNPHGSASAYSLQVGDIGDAAGEINLSSAAGVRNFCFACHTTSDTTKGYNGTGLVVVSAGTLFEGLDRTAGVLKLPAVTGHREGDAQSCYQCHGGPTSSSANNVHNPSGGVSAGGQDCYSCHSQYMSSMEDGLLTDVGTNRANVYHHVLGSATNEGDKAFAAGAYPTSTSDVYCMSCHVDHDKFNSAQASNLRPDIATTNPAGAATDYNSTSNTGVCTACHATSLAKQGVGTDQKSDGSTATPKILAGGAANQFGASAHDYYATSTYGDATTFSANCSKCHNDEQAKDFQTSTYRFGTHWSASRRLVSALGGTVADPLQEAHCYRCHSLPADGLAGTKKTAAGKDYYGVQNMTTAGTERVFQQFQLASKHPVVAAGGDSVECESCHNPHVVNATTGKVTDPMNGYNAIAYATDANQATFCLRCHGNNGTGTPANLPAYTVNATTYVPYAVTMASGTTVTAINNKNTYAARGHWSNNAAAGGSIGAGEEVSCAECHDNHGSAAPKLLGAYDPASGTNKIGTATITANDNTVCTACHTGATTGFPTAARQTGTGYPVNGVWPGSAVYGTAWNSTAHTGSPHTTANGGGASSLPAYGAGDCKVCHDVHGTVSTYDELRPIAGATSFDNDTFTLCFDCHDTDGPAARNVKTYYPASVGGSGGGTGHVIRTAGGNLPVGGVVPCYDCHNAHGSASAYSLLVVTMTDSSTTIALGDSAGEIVMGPTRTATNVRNFCFSCHTSANSAYGWNGTALAIVGAGAKVEGLDRTTGTRLRLPTRSGHNSGDTQSCYQCHGNDYSGLSTNNIHNPSGGVSAGGQDCYGCHSGMQTYMEDGTGAKTGASRATVYHHVLGSATNDGDRAFPLGTYPTSTTDVFCLSCHVDHGRFTPTTKSSNLRGDFTSTPSAAATDWNSTNGGICLSCHGTSLAKDVTGNRKSDGRTATPVVANAGYNASAHQYPVTSQFSDGTSFSAQCSKCHNDENSPAYKDFQTSTYRFGPHWSAAQHILSALGGTVADELQESHCYRCHSQTADGLAGTKKTVANRDWYNSTAMTTAAERVFQQFQLASRHPVVAAGGDSVECESCHNAHVVDKTTGKLTDPDNTYTKITYASDATQAAFCLKCHDGTLPARTINGTTYIPYTVTQANTVTNNKSAFAARGHWSQTGSIGAGEEVSCAECHDNHGSAAPKLLGQFDPASGASRIQNPVTLTWTAITANDNTVCTACHTGASTGFPASRTGGYPQNGTWPGATVYSGANGIHKGATVVWPASGLTGGDCKNCHNVHGTAYTYDETVGQFNPASAGNDRYALCFNCHDGSPSAKNIKQYYPTADGGLASGGNYGHVIKTAGGTLSAGQGLPCYDCHNPHGSATADGLLVMSQNAGTIYAVGDAAGEINLGTAAGNRQFCFLCHSTADATARVTDPTDGVGYVNVSGTALVEGLNRAAAIGANKLRLPAVSGHYEADTSSCYGCHGNDYTSATSNNVHNPGAGGSNGGSVCNTCHAGHATMTNDTTTYHHVLDSATPFRAPNATSNYPTSTTALECVSCHVDHNYFNTQKGFNLRTDLSATAVPANTDFPGGGSYGVCIACHSVAQTKNATGQKVGGSTVTPAISGSRYDTSAHDYQVNSGGVIGFGTDAASTFKANCSKCHDDDMDTGSKMSSTYKIGVHKSSENRIAKALGAALVGTSTSSEENLCFKCHTGGASTGPDGYGINPNGTPMTARSRNLQAQFSKTSKHNVAGYAGIHKADEYTAAPTQIAPGDAVNGWWGATNSSKHVECEDCHNPHVAQKNLGVEWPDAANLRGTAKELPGSTTGVTVFPENLGVWGVTVSGSTNGNWAGGAGADTATWLNKTPVIPTYAKVAEATYEWQLCLKCHSRYAWGQNAAPAVPSGVAAASGTSVMTDVGQDFNPSNYAYHPIFASGKNQPSPSLYSYWDTDTDRRLIAGSSTGNGLSNTFVDGWLYTSRVTCSDCHGNDSWGSTRGPHGSSNKWLLRGVNTGVKVTKPAATVSPNATANAGSWCNNCHRWDVYGGGYKDGAGDEAFSRSGHLGGGLRVACNDGQFIGSGLNGCIGCHGGRPVPGQPSNGLIHGTRLGKGDGVNNASGAIQDGTAVGDPMGDRFCNGAAWDAHQTGKTGTIGCSTNNTADQYSSCTQHTGTWAKTYSANYNY